MIRHFFERLLFYYGKIIYAFRYRSLIAVALLSLLAIYSLRFIELDSNLSALLPEKNPVVQNLNEVSRVYGGLGYLIAVVRSKESKAVLDFFNQAVPKIKEHPEVRYVEYRKPYAFFEKNLLLYAETRDLNTLYQRLQNKFEYERTKNNPLLVDFGTSQDPGLRIQDLISKYRNKYKHLSRNNSGPLREYIHKFDKDSNLHTFLLLIKPRKSAINVKYSSSFLAEMQRIIDQYRNGKIQVEFGGRFKKSPDDFWLMQQDFKTVTVFSVGGILLILVLFFRSFWPVIVIFIPLLNGILWTLGFVGMSYGSLNLITSFLVAILLGLGIDYGIHLLIRFEEDKRYHKNLRRNFLTMVSQTGAANFASALTTALAFFALSFTEFKAFREFGVIAGAGILFLFFSMVTLIPAFILILEQGFGIQLHKTNWSFPASFWKYPGIMLSVAGVFSVVAVLELGDIRFDYDFSKIQAKSMPSHRLDAEINAMLGRAQNPTVILPANNEQERKIIKVLQEEIQKNRDKKDFMIDQVIGSTMFIPENQGRKIFLINKIRNLLRQNRKYKVKLNRDLRKKWDELWQMVNVKKINFSQLPESMRYTFSGIGNYRDQRVILLFPLPGMVLGLDWLHFANNLHELQFNGKSIKAASDELIFAEILKMMKQEGPFILSFAFLAVLIVVSINFTSVFEGGLTVLPLLMGILWILGFMALQNFPVDFFNVIMFPIIIGIGIDSSIHIYHRYKESGDMLFAVRHTSVPVMLSSLTTIIGFGALLFASNKAMQSMGKVAILGIIFTFIISLFILASIIFSIEKIMHLRQKRKKVSSDA